MFRLTQQFEAGEVVLYDHQNALLLAIVMGIRQDKTVLLNERGREVQLQSSRLHKLPKSLSPLTFTTKEQRLEALCELRQRAEMVGDSLVLGDLWEFVVERSREYTAAELTALYFGEETIENHVGVRLRLNDERIYFKRTKSGFVPRPSEIVDELKRADEVKQLKEERQIEISNFFSARIGGEALECPAHLTNFLQLLFDTAARCDDLNPEQKKDVKNLLEILRATPGADAAKPPGGSSDESDFAFHFLLTAGLVDPDENLFLRRHRMAGSLSPEVERVLELLPAKVEEIAALSVPYSQELFEVVPNSHFSLASQRVDLTHLQCFTIDDVSTSDADDAVSLESSEDGYSLGIHITDVATVVQKDDKLDNALAERATSIYLADRTCHMIPHPSGRAALSLLPGGKRLALSLFVHFSRDFKPVHFKLAPSVVTINKKCTYEEVDKELYDSHSLYEVLYQIASTLEAERLAHGAVKIEKREAVITPTEDGGLKVEELDENTPAKMIIRELMILYNNAVAELAKLRGIPLPFRCQDAPDPSPADELSHIPPGPALDLAVRSRLKRSYISPHPCGHSSLGLGAYTQSTSPIRRYLDLIAQRQIHSILEQQEVPYSEAEIQKEVERVSPALAKAFAISKDTKRYWQLRYLEEKMRHRVPIEATVIRLEKRYQLVMLEEIYMVAQTKSLGEQNLGDVVSLDVTSVSARGDVLRLAKAKQG